MHDYVLLMRAMGYVYTTQEKRFLRLDRFLHSRTDLGGASLPVLIREWAKTRPGAQQALECHLTGRALYRALSRINPAVKNIPWDRRIKQEAHRRHRRPYIFSGDEIRSLLRTALSLTSSQSSLRPRTAYMILVLGYCAGLRISEIVRLDVGDFHLEDRILEIRGTKFFKSRHLPLSESVCAALRSYLDLRKQAEASINPAAPLFWHQGTGGRYSYGMARTLLIPILRRAGFKPLGGRIGARIHDLRHAFVVNRMLAWYREGVNPQSRLPYLATYLGHKDINSTIAYLTITQELLQQASERFRVRGARVLGGATGGGKA